MSEIKNDMKKIKPMDLDINGMTNIPDVINMIVDTIDNKDNESAVDYVLGPAVV